MTTTHEYVCMYEYDGCLLLCFCPGLTLIVAKHKAVLYFHNNNSKETIFRKSYSYWKQSISNMDEAD